MTADTDRRRPPTKRHVLPALIGYSFAQAPVVTTLTAITAVLAGAAPVGITLAIGGLVDGLTSAIGQGTDTPAAQECYRWVAVIVVLFLLTHLATLASFALLLFLKPPHRFFATWTAPVADRRPAWLAALLTVAFAIVAAVPVLSSSFGLAVVPEGFAIAVPAVLVWYVALAAAFRCRVVDRLIELAPRRAAHPATR